MPSSLPKNATHPTTAPASFSNGAARWSAPDCLCVLLLVTVLGGYTRLGASTNAGWFALIVALMCLPFGALLLTLGLAKWLRNRRLARASDARE